MPQKFVIYVLALNEGNHHMNSIVKVIDGIYKYPSGAMAMFNSEFEAIAFMSCLSPMQLSACLDIEDCTGYDKIFPTVIPAEHIEIAKKHARMRIPDYFKNAKPNNKPKHQHSKKKRKKK